MTKPFWRWLAIGGSGLLLLAGCSTTYRAAFTRQRDLERPEAVDQQAPFAKCHMRDGSVYVLERWHVDRARRVVSGTGEWLDVARVRKKSGTFSVGFDEIALLETNRPERVTHTGLIVVGVVATASLGMTAFCLANPKACFGSCPTFYAPSERGYTLQAEGFSASVARAFEATDVDALDTLSPESGRFELWVTNEALETHLIDSVALIAVARRGDMRAFRSGNRYYAARAPSPPLGCRATGSDCLAAVSALDEREYSSLSDPEDLGREEQIELEFPARSGKLGLVVGARNTLLNTFVFYQGLAYLGDRAGEFFARLENGTGDTRALRELGGLLGDLRLELAAGDRVVEFGKFTEVGPIAREVELFVLPDQRSSESLTVRLSATRANFRLDYVALVELGEELAPRRLEPVAVVREGREDFRALELLRTPNRRLVTYPGDSYELAFDLPRGGPYDLFVESRGYYYEWVREEWLREQSARQFLALLSDPRGGLRELAPRYHALEPQMDELFWKSRVPPRVRPPGAP